MGFLAAAVPLISAIGGLAGTAVSAFSALKKPPTAKEPKLKSLSTAEDKMNPNVKASLINTSPQGLLDESTSTSRQSLLGS